MSEGQIVPNEALRRAELPSPGEARAIFEFAMTFNGYDHFGSFEACSENAATAARRTLTDLRNELFFAARASRHRGDNDYVETYGELYPFLLAQVPA